MRLLVRALKWICSPWRQNLWHRIGHLSNRKSNMRYLCNPSLERTRNLPCRRQRPTQTSSSRSPWNLLRYLLPSYSLSFVFMFHVSPQSDMRNPTAKIAGPFFGLDMAMGSVRLWCSMVGGTHAWIWGILFFTPFLFICKPVLIFRDFFSMATQPITLASHFLYICDCKWILAGWAH